MSIWSSLQAPSDTEHEEGCAFYFTLDEHTLEISDNPCNCGQPDAPIVYQGSHHLPEETDERGGGVDLAAIAPHVRFWREHPNAFDLPEPELPYEPFLRFGVNEGTVVLTRRHVMGLVETLNHWLELSKPKEENVNT